MSQSKLKQVFSYQSWVHAVSGSAGSVIAMSAFYPLDTVRSRLQLEEPDRRKALSTWRILMHLIEEEGFATLYRGLVPVLQSLCISNFVYFYTFHSLKALRAASAAAGGAGPGAGQSALGDLLLGSLAGVVNVLTTTPFWVVNTRLKMKGIDQQQQQQRLLGGTSSSVRNGGNHSNHRSIGIGNSVKYDGLLDGLQYIARTEGIRGLWAGAVPSLLLVINPAIQFMVYEALKRKLTEGRHPASGSSPSAITFFSIGAIAKMIATVLTYPLQLVQTKLRHGNADKSLNLPADIDTVQLLLIILKRQGVAGLYRGLEAKLLQTVLTAALMFMAYEKIARFVTSLLISPKNVKGLH